MAFGPQLAAQAAEQPSGGRESSCVVGGRLLPKGQLARQRRARRGGGSSPATPEAQCLGWQQVLAPAETSTSTSGDSAQGAPIALRLVPKFKRDRAGEEAPPGLSKGCAGPPDACRTPPARPPRSLRLLLAIQGFRVLLLALLMLLFAVWVRAVVWVLANVARRCVSSRASGGGAGAREVPFKS